jgi:hypothetical protein
VKQTKNILSQEPLSVDTMSNNIRGLHFFVLMYLKNKSSDSNPMTKALVWNALHTKREENQICLSNNERNKNEVKNNIESAKVESL